MGRNHFSEMKRSEVRLQWFEESIGGRKLEALILALKGRSWKETWVLGVFGKMEEREHF